MHRQQVSNCLLRGSVEHIRQRTHHREHKHICHHRDRRRRKVFISNIGETFLLFSFWHFGSLSEIGLLGNPELSTQAPQNPIACPHRMASHQKVP